MAFDLSTLSAELKLMMCFKLYSIYQKFRLEAVKFSKDARKRPVTQARDASPCLRLLSCVMLRLSFREMSLV